MVIWKTLTLEGLLICFHLSDFKNVFMKKTTLAHSVIANRKNAFEVNIGFEIVKRKFKEGLAS